MALLAASLMLLLVVVNYLLHRDFMYPGFVQALLWFVAVSLLLLAPMVFIPVSDTVFVLLLAGVMMFSLGAFVGSWRHKPYLERNYLLDGTLPTKRAISILAPAVVLGLVVYVMRARELASSGPSNNWFINLRYALSVTWEETGGDLGPVAYFIPLAYLLAAITIFRRRGLSSPRGSRHAIGLAVLIGTAFGVLSSGRSVLLPLIIVVLAIPAVLRATTPVRTGAALVVLALLLFVTVGVALGKGGSLGTTVSENWPSMRESFFTYAVGGIPALNTFMHNRGPDVQLGWNSFRTIFAVLHGLGFHTTAAPLVQPYVDIPIPYNVYTVYQPYLKDFGDLGALAVLFVLGFLHAAVYRRATVRHPHALYVFLFAISLFPLVMQVFQDMYFTVLSLWIQYGVWSWLLFVVLNERQFHGRVSPPALDLGYKASHAQ